ncbi:MAG: hypothetical protein ACSHX9_15125 [Luteolibacter sp.]
MHHLKRLLQITCFLSCVTLAGCSSKKSRGMVSKEDMFPSPSSFSGDCVVDEQLSDEIAVQIANGVYKDSGVRTAANSNIVQCYYKNPKLIITISHFEDPKECETVHLKDGIGVSRKLEGFQEFDEIGVDGYLADFVGENLGFRWGNLSVVVNSYDEADRAMIIEVLKSHYESVTD